jgi:hypothetical protein
MNETYPVRFAVDYPERDLNRLTTALRIFMVIPIALVLTAIGGYSGQWGGPETGTIVVGGTGLLFLPTLLLIVFRQKYPRWWFDWNLELLRFTNRVGVYFALMDDRYPSTDAQQAAHLDFAYPRCRARAKPVAAARQVVTRHPPLHHSFLPLHRGDPCVDRRLVRDRVHRALPARDLRIRGGCAALAQPSRRLRVHPRDRRVPAVPARGVTRFRVEKRVLVILGLLENLFAGQLVDQLGMPFLNMPLDRGDELVICLSHELLSALAAMDLSHRPLKPPPAPSSLNLPVKTGARFFGPDVLRGEPVSAAFVLMGGRLTRRES